MQKSCDKLMYGTPMMYETPLMSARDVETAPTKHIPTKQQQRQNIYQQLQSRFTELILENKHSNMETMRQSVKLF